MSSSFGTRQKARRLPPNHIAGGKHSDEVLHMTMAEREQLTSTPGDVDVYCRQSQSGPFTLVAAAVHMRALRAFSGLASVGIHLRGANSPSTRARGAEQAFNSLNINRADNSNYVWLVNSLEPSVVSDLVRWIMSNCNPTYQLTQGRTSNIPTRDKTPQIWMQFFLATHVLDIPTAQGKLLEQLEGDLVDRDRRLVFGRFVIGFKEAHRLGFDNRVPPAIRERIREIVRHGELEIYRATLEDLEELWTSPDMDPEIKVDAAKRIARLLAEGKTPNAKSEDYALNLLPPACYAIVAGVWRQYQQ